jgi:hypothetical protein
MIRKLRLANKISAVAQVLSRSTQLIAAVTGADKHNNYAQALSALQRLSLDQNIPIAIVGGAATIHHGYPRSTKDLDIVVRATDFERILKEAYRYGIDIVNYNPTGFHELKYKDVPIEVIQEGTFGHHSLDPASTPSPEEMGVTKGLNFASLATWVRMKLTARRRKDEADVVEVLKQSSDAEINQVRTYLANLDRSYLVHFDQLLSEARAEQERFSNF